MDTATSFRAIAVRELAEEGAGSLSLTLVAGARGLENTITFNVLDAPPMPAPGAAGTGGEIPVPVEESAWDKLLKAVFGFFGFSGG